jgi:hypothetical protein
MQTTTSTTGLISLPNLVSSLIGALLAIVVGLIIEAVKHWQEKQRLINLFIADIKRTNLEIDGLRNVPTGEVLARAKGELLGIGNVTFTGKPEFELEVFNVRLWETQGIRLAQLLGSSGLEHFWAAYHYLRGAEAIRLVIKQFPAEERDYDAYAKVFVGLIGKGSDALSKLYRDLWEERSSLQNYRDSLSSSNS